MTVRRSSPREERRRRVLVEERHAAGGSSRPTEGVPRTRATTNARYTSAARAEQQPRTIDLLPKRLWTLSVWFLVGLCVVVAHATLYTGYLRWHAPEQQQLDLSAWDLNGSQNLARWSSSCMLLASAVLALQILQLRRHRVDDYRARYRLWYYVIAVLLIASMDSVAGLHRIVESGTRQIVTRSTLPLPASSLLWMLLVVGTALAVSLLFEIRASRGAVLCVALSGVAYVANGVLRQGQMNFLSDPLLTIVEGLTLLTGHYLLLMSLVVYGRHVHFDAQGRLLQATKRRRIPAQRLWSSLPFLRKGNVDATESADKSSDYADQTKRAATEPAESEPESGGASRRSAEQERSSASRESDEAAEDDAPSTLPLSRSERKRLRKQQKRDRRAA